MGLNVMLQRRLAARVAAPRGGRRAGDGGARPRAWLAGARASSSTSAASGTATRPSGPPWLAVPPFERPERLAATFRALEGSGVLRHLERLPARSAPRAALELVHDASHVERVLAEPRDDDPARPRGVDRARAAAPPRCSRSAGCSRRSRPWSAARSTTRSCSAGRPGTTPRRRGRWASACFNATAVAARWAQLARGAARVAILDWDVHHGNGTEAIFRDDASVLTISLHQDGLYPADTGAVGAPGEAIVNVPLPAGHRRRRLRAGLRARRRARDPRLRAPTCCSSGRARTPPPATRWGGWR